MCIKFEKGESNVKQNYKRKKYILTKIQMLKLAHGMETDSTTSVAMFMSN